MNPEVGELVELSDPEERAVRAGELVSRYQTAVTELSRIRREALEELVGAGMTQGQIAERIGMTRARVGQLLNSGPRSERAFLGTGTLTIAIGGKREANKKAPGSVVAREDFDAYEQLQDLARSVSLDTCYEVIEPPGMVNLNRDNLIVVCGPRLSPLIGQVLASDVHIGFGNEGDEWFLRDKTVGHIYRSPIEQGESSDFAYLGRLPRLDGRGGFLYVAGIHAIGAAGVIHFLVNNMSELYKSLKLRRFSTVIQCTFDADSRQIKSSERVAPLYKQDMS